MEDWTPRARWTRVQPWRGLFGLAVTFGLSLVITVNFTIDSYLGLLTLWIMAAVPLEIVMTLGWRGKYPPADSLAQPWRGILMTVFLFLVGTAVCFTILRFVGAGAAQPFTSAYVICTVILTIVAVAAFGMWPLQGLSAPARGFLTLAAVYLVVFYGIRLFDFSMLSYPAGLNPSPAAPVPFYAMGGPLADFAHIAPRGPIPWETGMTFWFWIAPLVFTTALLGFWPLSKSPKLMKQPTMGVIVFGVCAAISFILYRIGVGMLQIEPLRFMFYGVCYAFGVLLILVLLQGWPGRLIRGPVGGFVNTGLAILLAIAGYHSVGAICAWHFGKAMVYPANLFAMGNFMLGLNFPLWVAYADVWDFWPLPPTPPAAH